MGFFSEIASEARRGMAAPATPKSASAPPLATPEAPAAPSAPTPSAPSKAITPSQADPAPSAHTPSPPEVKLTVEKDASQTPDDTASRQAHEATEAKRKAEWDTKQAEKKAARQKQLDKIAAMDSDELLAAAVGRVAADTEKLTRRNMKEAVAEHIQVRCREDTAFAMLVMDPGKAMVNCFRYINRKAREYAEQEMKDNGIEHRGVYGLDVPDGLVYQWAEDYFRDENAEEDHKDDEKFVPKPYVPKSGGTKTKAAKKKPEKKPAAEKPKSTADIPEQISLM